ncbi:restriction endonuclease subunit S [Streptomyces sp. NPDC004284]|uniref:restriction endonuclease subunit S n=1 Tax=Streptomyces sp. NPDC004284 TaxID=3364695 RepID=UPI0036C86325
MTASTRGVRMGDVLRLSRAPVEIDPDKEYVALGMRSFGKGVIRYAPAKGSDLTKLRHFSFDENALALSNIKAWEGAIAVTSQEDVGAVASSRFLFYVPKGDGVDVRYLRYYFLSARGLAQIGQASPGSVDRNRTLSMKAFESIVVPLPDVMEQRRVADKIDALMAAHTHTTGSVPQRDSVRQLAVSGLERVLSRWAEGTVRVDQVCVSVNDIVHPGDDSGEAKEFVGLEHIAPHFGERIGSRPLGDEKGRKFRFAPGDVLYGYLRPYLNKVWLADQHGLCSVEQYVLRPNGVMPAELIAAGLRSKSILDRVLEATHNLQLPRLRSGLLMAMELPAIPPQHHERAIADITAFSQRVTALAARQRHRDELLAALRPAVLDAAFSGRL